MYKDPYETDIPESYNKSIIDVLKAYKDNGYDLSNVKFKGTTRARYNDGSIVPFDVLNLDQLQGMQVVNGDTVYMSPTLKGVMKYYGVTEPEDKFRNFLIAHELGHIVDNNYLDKKTRKSIIQDAKNSNFTTSYLENLPFKLNYEKELLAEYLATKVINGMNKKASFNDVEAIFNSLPKELLLMLSPRGYLVDSPALALRYITPEKDGFAEAYKLNGNSKDKAFVTIGIKPESQGKGLSKDIMQNLILQAKTKGIKKLIYRALNSNQASLRLATSLYGEPTRKFKDSAEWVIPVT